MKLTICGSARFEREFHEWSKRLAIMGHVVYSLTAFPSVEGEKTWYTDAEKETLDLVHLAKIEESDAVLILNVSGYVGSSTAREVAWARMRGKRVYWLEKLVAQRQPYELSADDIHPWTVSPP